MAGVLEALTKRSTKYALSLPKDFLLMTEERTRIKTPKMKLENASGKHSYLAHYLITMMDRLIPLQVREK